MPTARNPFPDTLTVIGMPIFEENEVREITEDEAKQLRGSNLVIESDPVEPPAPPAPKKQKPTP